MTRLPRSLCAALTLMLAAIPALADAPAPRTVVLGGTLAEIIAALGAEDQLVGRDGTATWPESLRALPDVGSLRSVSAEGVLSLRPELIIADPGAGPEAAVEVLKASGVSYVTVPYERTAEGVIAKIATTAAAIDRKTEGEALAAKLRKELDQVAARAAQIPDKDRVGVLFVMSLQGGKVMVAGSGSTPDSLITMAGARNVAAGIEGYKVMTDEAVIAAAPQVILMTQGGMDTAMSADAIRAHPALGHSKAAQDGRIVTIDGLKVLGFGPRVGEAALELHGAFYPAPVAGAKP